MLTLRPVLFIRRTVLLASLALIACLPALPTQAAEVLSGEVGPSASMGVVA